MEKRLKELVPKAEQMEKSLETTIPDSKRKIQELEAKIKGLVGDVDAVSQRDCIYLTGSSFTSSQAEAKESRAQSKCKEVAVLRAHVPVMDRDLAEAEDLQLQISSTERKLENTGSTRTMQEVQTILGGLDKDMYVFEYSVNREIDRLQRFPLRRSKSQNEKRLQLTNQRDQLNSSRLQAENDLSAKKLALSETKNRQASRKQAQDKIEELTTAENTLSDEIEVCSFPDHRRSPTDSLPLYRNSIECPTS